MLTKNNIKFGQQLNFQHLNTNLQQTTNNPLKAIHVIKEMNETEFSDSGFVRTRRNNHRSKKLSQSKKGLDVRSSWRSSYNYTEQSLASIDLGC